MPIPRIGEDKYYIKRLVGEPGDQLRLTIPKEFGTMKFTSNRNFADLVVRGDPALLERNGQPISGCTAFEENRLFVESLIKDPNASSKYGYPGYRTEDLLTDGKTLRFPARIHQAIRLGKMLISQWVTTPPTVWTVDLGGFVPEKAIIGRAFVVYYPFTKRWGFSD